MDPRKSPLHRSARSLARDAPQNASAPYADLDFTPFTDAALILFEKEVKKQITCVDESRKRALERLNLTARWFKIELQIDKKPALSTVLQQLKAIQSSLRRISIHMPLVDTPSGWSNLDECSDEHIHPDIQPAPDRLSLEPNFARKRPDDEAPKGDGEPRCSDATSLQVTATYKKPSAFLIEHIAPHIALILDENEEGRHADLLDSLNDVREIWCDQELIANFVLIANLMEDAVERQIASLSNMPQQNTQRGIAAQSFAMKVLEVYQELFGAEVGRSNPSAAGRGGPAARFLSCCFKIVELSTPPADETLVKWIQKSKNKK